MSGQPGHAKESEGKIWRAKKSLSDLAGDRKRDKMSGLDREEKE